MAHFEPCRIHPIQSHKFPVSLSIFRITAYLTTGLQSRRSHTQFEIHSVSADVKFFRRALITLRMLAEPFSNRSLGVPGDRAPAAGEKNVQTPPHQIQTWAL